MPQCACGCGLSAVNIYVNGHNLKTDRALRKRTGVVPKTTKQWEDIFWSKMKIPMLSEGCWLWPGRIAHSGYGMFGKRYAHRFSWESTFGSVDDGLCVLHHCDTPACVRPNHLFLGTKADNFADMLSKNRAVLRSPEKQPKGEDHPRAILTEKQVLFILANHYRYTQKALGESFDVSGATIGAIVTGRNWRHLQRNK